jgi:hypothetical protein
VASWDDVGRICLALPEVEEATSYGRRAWKVRGKGFVWERPLGKKDVAQLGGAAPTGPVLGASVPDEGAKFALIADDPAVFFTIPHFDGYPAVLVRLAEIDEETLTELAGEAWACRAPARLVARFRP